MLRMVVILAMMLFALTAASSGTTSVDIIGSSTGDAVISGGSGSINVDVVGSNIGDAYITSKRGESADVEVVGSTTGEINISTPAPTCVKTTCCCNMLYNGPICYPYSSYIPGRYNQGCCSCSGQSNCYPYNQSQHFGVDAWHGCYWYSPIYLPKWPAT